MSIIYDALKKLQKEIERKAQKRAKKDAGKNLENPQQPQTSAFAFIADTAILPPPRIPKSLIENTKLADEAVKPEYAKANPTIPAALKSSEEKRYQKIIVALCGATCVVLLFSIGYLLYTFQATRFAAAPSETQKVSAKKKGNKLIDLQGIMTMDDKQVALINDEIYEVGESVRGREIIAISLDSIQILDHRKVKTLYVKKKK